MMIGQCLKSLLHFPLVGWRRLILIWTDQSGLKVYWSSFRDHSQVLQYLHTVNTWWIPWCVSLKLDSKFQVDWLIQTLLKTIQSPFTKVKWSQTHSRISLDLLTFLPYFPLLLLLFPLLNFNSHFTQFSTLISTKPHLHALVHALRQEISSNLLLRLTWRWSFI